MHQLEDDREIRQAILQAVIPGGGATAGMHLFHINHSFRKTLVCYRERSDVKSGTMTFRALSIVRFELI